MMTEKKEGLYGETQSTKAQSIRFILTTVLSAVVILGIAVWGIIYAVSGKKDTQTDATKEGTTEIVSEENANSETSNEETVPVSGEHSGDDVVEVTNLKEEAVATTETATETKTETPAATTTAEKDIPKTGPEGILPVALLAGALVAFAGSAKLAKIKA